MILREDLYCKTYESSNPEYLTVGEVSIRLPDMPDERYIKNYELPIKDQKFRRLEIPRNMKSKSSAELDAFAKEQWHRRFNGEWWFIKGDPYYFPGECLPFFDSWTMEGDRKPTFRMEALELFWFWYLYVEPDPNIFGVFDLKCRRLGDTEKWNYILWERTTRFKNVKAGMQSYTDTAAQKSFSRLAKGNRFMPYYFKPLYSGSDKSVLAFMSPSEVMTMKKLLEQVGKVKTGDEDRIFLNSMIDFEATLTGKYDGEQLFTYFLDEIFKIKQSKLDAKVQWKNIKKVISLFNEMYVYGKAILASTVESIEVETKTDVETTRDVAEYFWDNSDPLDLNENGRTKTGLVRIFRGYKRAADIDEWGFHKEKEATEFRNNQLKQFQEDGKYDEILDIYRKQPATPEEALADTSEKCPLHPEMCYNRQVQLKEGTDRYGDPIPNYKPKVIQCNLEWEGGIPRTKVVLVPSDKGRWFISQRPIRPNAITQRVMKVRDKYGNWESRRLPYPENMAFYRMGVDPYEADDTLRKGSDGAFSVKRRLDLMAEVNEIQFDDYGVPLNPEDMLTNKYVLDYKHRHKNPEMFYWDVIKTCWYFGVKALVEDDKPGLGIWMRDEGFHAFMQYEPKGLMPSTNRRKQRMGVKTSAERVSAYTERLSSYIYAYVMGCDHPRLLKSWAQFVPAKRTKYDLAVATGWTELAELDYGYKKPDEEQESNGKWKHDPYQFNKN
jgi:hypothetical protein